MLTLSTSLLFSVIVVVVFLFPQPSLSSAWSFNKTLTLKTLGLAAWHSGNGVGRINEVTVRQTRLVLGWVTCPGSTPGGGTLFRYVTSHPGRLSLSSFQGR